jgi:cyanate permease
MSVRENYKTTLGGILAAVGLAAFGVSVMVEDGFNAEVFGALVSSLGSLLYGLFAQDAQKKDG